MKVFVFCAALLLAATVKALPLESEELDSSVNEIDNKSSSIENVENVEVEVDPVPEVGDNHQPEDDAEPAPEAFNAEENNEENEAELPEESLKEAEVENEESAEAVPYEEKSEDEEKPMTQEEMEVVYGIPIDICTTYSNPRFPLHLSHLKECGKFYKCYNGRGYLMDCPAGEHWSVHLDRCDYPEVARCKIDGTHHFKIRKPKPMQASEQKEEDDEEEKPETGDFEIDPRCEGSDPFKPMHYKHVNDCTKFYKCYMGRAYVIKCPRGQHWAQQLNRCEHASIAKCTLRPTAVNPPRVQAAQAFEESESESEESYESYEYYDSEENAYKISDDADFMIDDARCAPDEEDRFHPIQFAHPNDCGMFYKCFDHHAYKIQCPGGLHYSEESEACDFPEEANCKVGIAEAQAQEMFSAPSIPVCSKNKEENLPVEGSFTQYFSCKGGLAYLMECQYQEIYNQVTKKCEKVDMSSFPMFPMMPDGMMPDMSIFLNNMPQFPNGMPQFPNGMPQFPNGMPQFPNGMPQFPNGMPQFPNGMPQFPNGFPQFPNGFPQFPNFMPEMPMAPRPPVNSQLPEVPQRPQRPIIRPEPEIETPQAKPDFPSWMPVPNPNVQLPKFPTVEKPSENKPAEKNEFDYTRGKTSSKCPSSDNPMKPQHVEHENDCSKFYKCYNGRAFLMECPKAQQWSSELQRCDYPQFAKCDPIELMKKKMQI